MELNIHFINVGQGDTILLSWKEEPKAPLQFGLIDCNLVDGNISYLKHHIDDQGIKEFEFVLMSHPHADHFSGFPKFFDYCIAKKIIIRRFLHTSPFNPKFLQRLLKVNIEAKKFKNLMLSGVNYIKHKQVLQSIFDRLLQEERNGFNGFLKGASAINTVPFNLASDIYIECLSPQNLEFAEYIEANYEITGSSYIKIEQDEENNPKANYLSSLIRIYGIKGCWQILLSSDCTKKTFKRVMESDDFLQSIKENQIFIVQVPHHGSDKNHLEDFWNSMPAKDKIDAVISVGEAYGHPSLDVVEYFDKNFQGVYATNFVGVFRDYYTKANNKRKALRDLTLNMPGVAPKGKKRGRYMLSELDASCREIHINISHTNTKPSCKIVRIPAV